MKTDQIPYKTLLKIQGARIPFTKKHSETCSVYGRIRLHGAYVDSGDMAILHSHLFRIALFLCTGGKSVPDGLSARLGIGTGTALRYGFYTGFGLLVVSAVVVLAVWKRIQKQLKSDNIE